MKKTITLLVLFECLFWNFSFAQITWSKILTPITTYTIEEGPDGTFISAMDSSGPYVLHLDAFGNTIWVKYPQVRTTGEGIFCAVHDRSGGFIVGGESPDTTGVYDDEPFVLRLDTN